MIQVFVGPEARKHRVPVHLIETRHSFLMDDWAVRPCRSC